MPDTTLKFKDQCWIGQFTAMASPCEILIEAQDKKLANELLNIVATEAWRIEKKFSRYRDDNIVYRINNSKQHTIEVDAETAHLLNFANTLYELSDGLFDITSGVLREAWSFDKTSQIPDPKTVLKTLQKVGWSKVNWNSPHVQLQTDMQVDFGGIGKEYAVDRVTQLIKARSDAPCLINFGGDLAITHPRADQKAWQIGIESADSPGEASKDLLQLYRGALATSGNVRRYLLKSGVRYGHILNPKTGWPIEHAPLSVTVAAGTCTEAGMLSTFGMLQGADCEVFLNKEDIKFWCIR